MVKKGDIFQSQCQTLANPVNCVGVMGKGLALAFRRRFPAMYTDYCRRCADGLVQPGRPYVWRNEHGFWVLNFPTKRHWRDKSRLEDIIAGLERLEANHNEWGIQSLAVPALGCGLGELDWGLVRPVLEHHLSRLAIPVEIYAPH